MSEHLVSYSRDTPVSLRWFIARWPMPRCAAYGREERREKKGFFGNPFFIAKHSKPLSRFLAKLCAVLLRSLRIPATPSSPIVDHDWGVRKLSTHCSSMFAVYLHSPLNRPWRGRAIPPLSRLRRPSTGPVAAPLASKHF